MVLGSRRRLLYSSFPAWLNDKIGLVSFGQGYFGSRQRHKHRYRYRHKDTRMYLQKIFTD